MPITNSVYDRVLRGFNNFFSVLVQDLFVSLMATSLMTRDLTALRVLSCGLLAHRLIPESVCMIGLQFRVFGRGVTAVSRAIIGCTRLQRRVCIRFLTGMGQLCIAVGKPLTGGAPFPLSVLHLVGLVLLQLLTNDVLRFGDLVAYPVVLVRGCIPGFVVLRITLAQ